MARRATSDTIQLKVRMKEPLRAQLEVAAKSHGVSLNTEIVDRLERSERQIEDVFGGREVYGIMRVIAAAIHETGHTAGFYTTASLDGARGWLRNPWAYDQATQAAMRVFEALRPEGDRSPPEGQEQMQNLGRGFASGILNEIARDEARTSTTVLRTEELRRDLGPLAERLTESETLKEDLKFNIQRDDQQQITVTLSKKKPETGAENRSAIKPPGKRK
jgi:hypothetical protein